MVVKLLSEGWELADDELSIFSGVGAFDELLEVLSWDRGVEGEDLGES
jgi:hypothetical protein